MFPEVYVENVESLNGYILEVDGEFIFSKKPQALGIKRFFGHIIYEDILNYIDLVKPSITRSFIVVKKYGAPVMEGVLVEKDTKPCLIEIRGHQPMVFVNEGDEIGEGDKIGYIITNKSEVRVVKSPCSGIVALVVNLPWERPEKYLLVVVSKNECRQITIRKSS